MALEFNIRVMKIIDLENQYCTCIYDSQCLPKITNILWNFLASLLNFTNKFKISINRKGSTEF